MSRTFCNCTRLSGASRTPPPTTYTKVGVYPEWEIEFILAPEGSIGEGAKSVKKNAALLHFLAFGHFDHLFGVPRGEQPLGRASRAIGSSGHFFGSFWVSKRNTWRKSPIKFKRAAARWRQADAATQQSKAGKIFHFVARFRHHQHPRAHTIVP